MHVFSKLPFLFSKRAPTFLCGRSYFFLVKEKVPEYGGLNKLQRFWYYCNEKVFSTPFFWFRYRIK